jgi:hypothetical protein
VKSGDWTGCVDGVWCEGFSFFFKTGAKVHLYTTAVIMHHMIIDDEQGDRNVDDDSPFVPAVVRSTASSGLTFDRFLTRVALLRDRSAYADLQNDLVEHLWKAKRRGQFVLFDEDGE